MAASVHYYDILQKKHLPTAFDSDAPYYIYEGLCLRDPPRLRIILDNVDFNITQTLFEEMCCNSLEIRRDWELNPEDEKLRECDTYSGEISVEESEKHAVFEFLSSHGWHLH